MTAEQTVHYIEWEGLHRPSEDAPLVRVYFTAGGWQPYVPQTWESPAEGGMYEDIFFLRTEIDPRDFPCGPLTDAEQIAAREWFNTIDGQELADRVAQRETGRVRR